MTREPNSKLFAWARGVAIATLAANVALYIGVVALSPSAADVAAHPNAFWPNTLWAFLFAPLTGVLFLLAVILAMEYRSRSLGNGDLRRRGKLRHLVFLLAPTLVHVIALFPLLYYVFRH